VDELASRQSVGVLGARKLDPSHPMYYSFCSVTSFEIRGLWKIAGDQVRSRKLAASARERRAAIAASVTS
jgi:hypothetical protein